MSLYTYAKGGYQSVSPSGVVDVSDWGATGDGATDDTDAINAAIVYASTRGIRTVVVPDGTYMIRAHDPAWTVEQQQGVVFYVPEFPGGIKMLSGIHLKLSHGATLKAIPNDAKWYRIIGVADVSNIEISGGTIQGERAAHLGAYGGEWGHGISILSSTDVYIHDLTIKDCWGDGINTNLSSLTEIVSCERIRVARVLCYNNRRQGMSISSGIDVTVEDSEFSNTNGTSPESGLDIESNGGDKPTHDITIRGCRFDNNNGSGIGSVDGWTDRVTITDCRFNGNKGLSGKVGQIWFVTTAKAGSYKFKDNWFGAPVNAPTNYNIFANGGSDCEITGNVMTGGAMKVSVVTRALVADNTIHAAPATVAAVQLDRVTELKAHRNRVAGGSIGLRLASTVGTSRLSILGNTFTGATGAAISIEDDTTNVMIRDNVGFSNGAGVYFDTAKTHTGHSIDTAWMDGTDTLPS